MPHHDVPGKPLLEEGVLEALFMEDNSRRRDIERYLNAHFWQFGSAELSRTLQALRRQGLIVCSREEWVLTEKGVGATSPF